MKLVRFLHKEKTCWGKFDAVSQNIETDINETESLKSFQDVLDFFAQKEMRNELCIDVIAQKDVELLPPVLPTKNVLCIGKNYYDHILELDGSDKDIELIKERPIFFSKALSSITAPNTSILLHKEVTNAVDYEAELAVVIGKKGINIAKENALEYVYGYTILNDVTSRDLQDSHQQWMKGKSLDTHCPIGPWVVSADEIEDPQNLAMKSIVNGEVRQDSNTKHMIHGIADLIVALSKGMTLEVGDVIATGTPKGVGIGFDPPRYLQQGDTVEIVIENIGTLINTVE